MTGEKENLVVLTEVLACSLHVHLGDRLSIRRGCMHGPARDQAVKAAMLRVQQQKLPRFSVLQPRHTNTFVERRSTSTSGDQTGKTPEKLPLSCTTTTHNPHARQTTSPLSANFHGRFPFPVCLLLSAALCAHCSASIPTPAGTSISDTYKPSR